MTLHTIKLVSEKVQLAVQLIDDFSGEVVKEDVSVTIEGQFKQPILNLSGYFVFTKLEGDVKRLIIKSKFYYPVVINIDLEDYKENQQLIYRLTPNTIYPFPSNATLIRGRLKEKKSLRIHSCSKAMAVAKIIQDCESGTDIVMGILLHGQPYKGMLMYISDLEEHGEWCVLDSEKIQKEGFKLKNPLAMAYPKGTFLLYAREVFLDQHLQFTIYISKMYGSPCTFELSSEDRDLKIEVSEGKVHQLGLIEL